MYVTATLNHAGGGQLNDFNPEYLISIQLLTIPLCDSKLSYIAILCLHWAVKCIAIQKPHGKWAS